MRGRKRQQGSISSAAALVKGRESTKQKEKEARKERAKEKEAREAGREPAAKERQMRRKAGKEKEMGGEGKEPAKEKEVREAGKEKAKAKAAAESVCPQFFKVFFPEQSTERLRIPPMFHQHLKEQPTGPVSLRGPSGNRWQAALASESESESEAWCFDQGWKEFVTDHSLMPGHFLVFTRDGPSQFSVAVFASSGVIDPVALDARPTSTNDAAVKLEEGEGVGVRADVDAGDTSDSEVSLLPPEEGDGVAGKRMTGKRTRAMGDLPADANAPKKHSTVSTLAKKADKRRPQAATSKDVSMILHNPTFSLLDESKTFNKTQIRDKNVPRSGKFLLRTTKAPVVISQRRLVTEEEKGLALRKAMEFKSKHPFTMQIMIESYVYVGFFMNIAREFVRESLPRTSKKMTLWDPLGKPWDVSYVYYGDRAAGSFGGGWGRFALGNNLEKSDVCVFELFKEDNMRVHIYRVVPEITPLLRASNKD